MRILGLLLAIILLGCNAVASAYAAANATEEITHLLEFVATSSCAFIRNGQVYPAAEARAHLERKYTSVRDRIMTAEDFIHLAASRSSTSGKPYMVRCGTGHEQLSSEWFKSELRRFRDQAR